MTSPHAPLPVTAVFLGGPLDGRREKLEGVLPDRIEVPSTWQNGVLHAYRLVLGADPLNPRFEYVEDVPVEDWDAGAQGWHGA
jgi:hypothetical protein